MCCFSRPVPYVSGTKIFARATEDDRQALVYSMSIAVAEELAMVLPLPVPPGPAEDAVRFVSLERYAGFFDDMNDAFGVVASEPVRRGGGTAILAFTLKVHEVGDFEASFVPTLADFDRLDARFKLAPEVWERLPCYADWGFAVFKLAPKTGGPLRRGFGRPPSRRIHPMAFTFPRRDPSELFFPTVHVHDGQVHERAMFDHQLYCQTDAEPEGWERSERTLGDAMGGSQTEGLIAPERFGYRLTLRGQLPNEDHTVR